MDTSQKPHKRNTNHLKKKRQHPPLMFSSALCVSVPSPTRQSSFPDRKSLQGLSPHHRWPFNTSLATANETRSSSRLTRPGPTLHKCLSLTHLLCWDERCTSTLARFSLCLFIYFHLFVAGSWHFELSFGGVCSCDATNPLPRTSPNKHHLAWFRRNGHGLGRGFAHFAVL